MHSVPIEVGLSDDAFDLLPDHYFPTQKQASKALKKDQRTQYALEKEGAIYFYFFVPVFEDRTSRWKSCWHRRQITGLRFLCLRTLQSWALSHPDLPRKGGCSFSPLMYRNVFLSYRCQQIWPEGANLIQMPLFSPAQSSRIPLATQNNVY